MCAIVFVVFVYTCCAAAVVNVIWAHPAFFLSTLITHTPNPSLFYVPFGRSIADAKTTQVEERMAERVAGRVERRVEERMEARVEARVEARALPDVFRQGWSWYDEGRWEQARTSAYRRRREAECCS